VIRKGRSEETRGNDVDEVTQRRAKTAADKNQEIVHRAFSKDKTTGCSPVLPQARDPRKDQVPLIKRKGGSQMPPPQDSSLGKMRLRSGQAFENNWSTYSQFIR
jgi:hypothetical protein